MEISWEWLTCIFQIWSKPGVEMQIIKAKLSYKNAWYLATRRPAVRWYLSCVWTPS